MMAAGDAYRCKSRGVARAYLRAAGIPAQECDCYILQEDKRFVVQLDSSNNPIKLFTMEIDMSAIRKPRTEGIAIRLNHFPPYSKQHLTGDALIAHIKAFDMARGLRPGNRYIIGGKEVVI